MSSWEERPICCLNASDNRERSSPVSELEPWLEAKEMASPPRGRSGEARGVHYYPRSGTPMRRIRADVPGSRGCFVVIPQ